MVPFYTITNIDEVIKSSKVLYITILYLPIGYNLFSYIILPVYFNILINIKIVNNIIIIM